jgi:hypothetical protein
VFYILRRPPQAKVGSRRSIMRLPIFISTLTAAHESRAGQLDRVLQDAFYCAGSLLLPRYSMDVTFDGHNAHVRLAVEQANGVLKNPKFLDSIAAHPKFDMCDAPPTVIAGLIRTSALAFQIKLFRPRSLIDRIRYRKTFAYMDRRFPATLFLNEKKLDREVADVAATIVHESIHGLDNTESRYSFGHGDDSPNGKENTAPYWIGTRAYEFLTHRSGASPPSVAEVRER